ncbi:6931_t:CDS:2, partial [Racocetra fulgida]
PVPGTPLEYVQIYSDCWETEPTRRLKLSDILNRLKTTKLTPVFEDSVIPESEVTSDLYLPTIETRKIHEIEIFKLLYDNQTNTNNYCLLGFFYYVGIGTDQKYDEAFQLFINAAQGNNWIAQAYIGNCYLKGHGTQVDEKLAVEYYDKIDFRV